MNTPPPKPPPPSEPEPPPTLDPATVADDEELADVVDAFVAQDREGEEWLSEIAYDREAIRRGLEADLWTLVLHLDETVDARWASLTVAIARWAFSQGRRFPVQPEEVSP